MRESSRTPATATSTTSHHPACTGFPPRRTRRASTGRRTGSVTLRRVRPNPPERRHAAGAHEPAGERDQGGEAEGREYQNPKDRVHVVHGLKLQTAWGGGSGTRRCAAE